MTILLYTPGRRLTVSQQLTSLLSDIAVTEAFDIDNSTATTFNFRGPNHSQEKDGIHQVEIRLVLDPNGWLFDYVIDFSYQRIGQNAELFKALDFNFLDNEHFLFGWGSLQQAEACGVFALWQRLFLRYYLMQCFTVMIQGE